LEAAYRQLFDIIVIDAKLEYRGVEFGGIRLAEDLRWRYGRNSIIVISQYITSELMVNHGSNFEFVDKQNSGEGFAKSLAAKILMLRNRQYIFVAMPFATDVTDLYQRRVRPGIEAAGFRALRIDEVAHNKSIQRLIFETIEKAKAVVLVADNANPNAYYEAGFADAMQKEVLIVAKSVEELKFDVADRHTIFYGNRPSVVAPRIAEKLWRLRSEAPVDLLT
jgi:hypothetical protein